MWILLKQETVSGSGISWAICKFAPHSRQTTMPAPYHSVSTGQLPFLPPNQQRQNTEGVTDMYPFCHPTITSKHWSKVKALNQISDLTSSFCHLTFYIVYGIQWFCLQCFDAVGWAVKGPLNGCVCVYIQWLRFVRCLITMIDWLIDCSPNGLCFYASAFRRLDSTFNGVL